MSEEYESRIPECCRNRTAFHAERYCRTLNSQMQWPVMSTLCQEMKKHLNGKVGSERTPKLDPHCKLHPVACKVNMELRPELSL